MAVVVTLPWTKQKWALPFLCVLATTPEVSERLGKRHKTVGMRAHQMINLVRRWRAFREIKLMGDTAYTILELGLHANTQQVTLITTGRLDAVLHEPPPERTKRTHAASEGGGQASAFSRTGLTGPPNRLAEAHFGLVRPGDTNSGDLYGNSIVVPLWLRPLTHSVGTDS